MKFSWKKKKKKENRYSWKKEVVFLSPNLCKSSNFKRQPSIPGALLNPPRPGPGRYPSVTPAGRFGRCKIKINPAEAAVLRLPCPLRNVRFILSPPGCRESRGGLHTPRQRQQPQRPRGPQARPWPGPRPWHRARGETHSGSGSSGSRRNALGGCCSPVSAEMCHFIHQLPCHPAREISELGLSGSASGCHRPRLVILPSVHVTAYENSKLFH